MGMGMVAPAGGGGGRRGVASRALLVAAALFLAYNVMVQRQFKGEGCSRDRALKEAKQQTAQQQTALHAAAAGGGDEPKGSPVDAPRAAAQPQHIYVVGCGHSGTSVLKRTVAHLPGVHCIPKETWVWSTRMPGPEGYVQVERKVEAVRAKLEEWDGEAAAGGFRAWVEKTPMHVYQIGDILEKDPRAKVIFIVRDGRDVTASLRRRGFPLEDCRARWKLDNGAALPFLDRPEVLTVKFEEFFSAEGVLRVLRQISAHLGLGSAEGVDAARLLLALQPPTALLTGDQQCVAYTSEAAKEGDLGASLVALLAGRDADKLGTAPDRTQHQAFRSWQSSQAWGPQSSGRWAELLDAEAQAAMAADEEMQQLLKRFGYVE